MPEPGPPGKRIRGKVPGDHGTCRDDRILADGYAPGKGRAGLDCCRISALKKARADGALRSGAHAMSFRMHCHLYGRKYWFSSI